MSLPEIYNESIALFEKSFDLPVLVFDILSRVKESAVCGKLYESEIISVTKELFKIKIEFKTDENTYFDAIFNLENSLERATEFIGQLGYSLNNIESAVGEKYKIFYGNLFNIIILGKVNDGNSL